MTFSVQKNYLALATAVSALLAHTGIAYAQTAAATPAKPGLMDYLWPVVATFVIFYFFMMKPQKAQRARVAQLNAIEKGDEVVTKGGLIGKVTNIAEKILTLEIADQTRVKIDRDFIHAVNKAKA